MQIELPDNPNCGGSEQMVYRELGPVRPIKAIVVEERGKEILCDIVGVEMARPPKSAADAIFIEAKVVKIADSGAGYAFLIFGGRWGIRIRPQAHAGEAWELSNKHQWGEPYKIYGSEADIVYE